MAKRVKSKIEPKLEMKAGEEVPAVVKEMAEMAQLGGLNEENVNGKPEMTSVTFRTKRVTKQKAELIFGELGISMTGAINMFLSQVVRDRGIPFLPTTQRKDERSLVTEARGENGGYGGMEELVDQLWGEL